MKFLKLLFIIFITFLFASCSAIIGNNGFNPGGNWESIISEHLICYYRADSFAEQNIEQIVKTEEEAYQHIINTLDVEYGDIISIYIYNSPEDAGWDYVQGKAYCKEKIAVGIYSEEGKSIGVKGSQS